MARIYSSLSMGWATATPLDDRLLFWWHEPAVIYRPLSSDWQGGNPQDFARFFNWQIGTPANKGLSAVYDHAFNQDKAAQFNWDNPEKMDVNHGIKWSQSIAQDKALAIEYGGFFAQDAATAGGWFVSGSTIGPSVSGLYSPPAPASVVFDLAGEYSPPGANAVLFDLAIFIRPAVGGEPMQALDSHTGFPWLSPPPLDASNLQPWGAGISQDNKPPQIDWEIEPGDPLTPPPPPLMVKGNYYLMNKINLVTVQDRTPLAMDSFSIGMDIDSHSYTLNISLLNEASYNKIVPMTGPVDVELSINGFAMTFMVEQGGESGTLANKKWKATGASKTKLLAAPYSPKRSKSSAFATDAAALAAEETQGTGLTVNWPQGRPRDAVSWQMPAGVFSYEGKTPIEAIKALAATVGGVVVPHLDGSGLTIKPRWPVLPWALQSDNPDSLIHESMITAQTADYVPSAGFNELWVSGESHGYQTRVFRADTGGGVAGPEIVERWLTDPAANIQRGAQELAEASPMLLVSMSVIVLEQGGPGIIMPGQVIEVQHSNPAKNWRGLVLSNDIGAGSDGVDLFQNLKIARPI